MRFLDAAARGFAAMVTLLLWLPLVASDVLPAAPDYGNYEQWWVSYRQGAADIFYVISTETGDYRLGDGTLCHYADTYNDSVRVALTGEMQSGLLAGKVAIAIVLGIILAMELPQRLFSHNHRTH